MNEPRFTQRSTLHLGGTSVSAVSLRRFLASAPDDAVIRVYFTPGDPRDPREYDEVRLEWEG